MSELINIRHRLFNQPLLLEPSYAQVLFGALADRLGIDSLVAGEKMLDREALREGVFNFESQTDRKRTPYRIKGKTAIIPVSGSLVAKSGYLNPTSGMTGYDGIKANLDMAFADDDIDDIVLKMDSGGGEVNGCFELADFIYANRDTKPMTALVEGSACSACYALASACNKVVMSQTSTVGSIGVITAHTSVEKAMQERGVKVTLITAGEHKADGNPYEDLPDEVRARIQGRLDTMYSMFTERVAKYRGISVDAVVKTQALTYLGRDAIDINLADDIVSPIDFIENLSQSGSNFNLENNMPKDIEQENPSDAIAKATATGAKTGAQAMQQRIKGIMQSEHAEGRTGLAEHLAYETEMSVEQAETLLSKSPKEQAVVEEETVEQVDAGTQFNEAMEQNKSESVGTDIDGEEEVTAESDPVKFALQAHKLNTNG